ncbi:hypothetical protein JCM33374_g4722 [Metschnikowia sp. JCM 33374]|nr:hypothetical protein JCM33374_g4722 [Metschnikowia sp. JCM 33374]
MIPAGSRRSKIRPPRKLNTAAEPGSKAHFDYEASWHTIASAIGHIQNQNVSSLSYEQLYRIAYTVVLQKHGSRLYDDVSVLIGHHLQKRRTRVLEILESSLTNTHEEFLKAMADEWAAHLQSMKFISDVLMYLNRVYVKECRKLLIYDLGVILFETHFLRHNSMEVARHLVSVLNHEIAKSRSEALSTRSYVVKMIAMLEVVSTDLPGTQLPSDSPKADLYHGSFESELLSRSEAYFSAAADDALAASSGTSYLHETYRLIHDEEARLSALSTSGSGSTSLLRTETYPKLIQLMNNILIRGKLEHVMVYPIEMQGLSYWLEPVFARALSKLNSASASVSGSSSPDFTKELHMLYELEGRIDPERKRLKVRLRELIVQQGLRLPQAVLSHLQQQASLSAASGAKKPPVTYAATPFVLGWIDSVLQYQRQLGSLVTDAFDADPTVEFTVFASVKQFINVPGGRLKKKSDAPTLNAAELLSVYIDHYIKQFSKPATSKKSAAADDSDAIDETEDFFRKVVAFLKLVEDKYAFEAHYAAHFAKRFLNAKTSSTSASTMGGGGDIEDLVLGKLWEEVFMDSHYLERIVKMKKDVTSSAELTAEWKRHMTENNLKLAELELKICNLSEWPKSLTKDHKDQTKDDGSTGIIWPTQLRETMKVFEEFWLTGKRNDNKALSWYPKFGQMDLRITYPSRTYDINLSTYGGVIMMLFAPQSTDADGDPVSAFEEQRELTYVEISELTKIPEFDLKRQLRSIAVAPRSRLLVKSPMSKDINDTDIFKLNSKFKSPSTKVKVLTVKSDAPKGPENKNDEVDEVKNNIDEGRKHLINAAIVRTMKSRQSLKHNELIEEIIKQLQNRFLPPMVHIKQQVEDLIEKEYLRRDSDLPNVYHYIA